MKEKPDNTGNHFVMAINIILNAHVFGEERLSDQAFEEAHMGFIGKDFLMPLKRIRGQKIIYNYNEKTTIKDLEDFLYRYIWGSKRFTVNYYLSFETDTERFEIDNPNANLQYLVNKYLDPLHMGFIRICYYVSCDAGTVGPEKGPLRYYMHSKEQGRHFKPHVHVTDTGFEYDASIDIGTGELLAGSLPGKLKKIAQKEILKNQDYYYRCWNTLTDGLRTDIDHHFGRISY